MTEKTDTDEAGTPDTAPEVVQTYKGFGLDWKCRDFQYEVGQSYEHTGPVAACAGGFHACEYPLDVLRYYAPADSRFAIVEQSGNLSRHHEDTKVASRRITVKAEISLPGLIQAAIDWTFSKSTKEEGAHTGKDCTSVAATGTSGAASATGYSGAASATGYSGAASATGYSGAAMASGRFGRAMGAEGCVLFLVERDGNWKIVHVWAGIAGQDGIKPLVWYTLENGKPVEVA